MTQTNGGYWPRLWAAIFGRHSGSSETTSLLVDTEGDNEPARLRARVATLEMDLGERDRQMVEMRAEYAHLQAAKERAAAGAGQEQLEKLFKRLAGTIANLAALVSLCEAGQTVEANDLVSLIRSLEKEFFKVGLEPIGHVGELTVFDLATHQRMSGGAVQSGTPVSVQLPGYKLGDKVLIKAMVSAREDTVAQETDHDASRD